jgi:hypothetical protein
MKGTSAVTKLVTITVPLAMMKDGTNPQLNNQIIIMEITTDPL